MTPRLLPAALALASVRVTPAVQLRSGDTLTQRALTIRVTIAGQTALDLVGGEAKVGGTGVGCGAGVAAQALRCTKRRLVLIDVVRRKSRVRLFSAADRALASRRVSCGGARVVKRFKPRRNGTFRMTLQGAKTRQVATFRFRTKVRFRVGNPHLLRTFTLPKYVDIG